MQIICCVPAPCRADTKHAGRLGPGPLHVRRPPARRLVGGGQWAAGGAAAVRRHGWGCRGRGEGLWCACSMGARGVCVCMHSVCDLMYMHECRCAHTRCAVCCLTSSSCKSAWTTCTISAYTLTHSHAHTHVHTQTHTCKHWTRLHARARWSSTPAHQTIDHAQICSQQPLKLQPKALHALNARRPRARARWSCEACALRTRCGPRPRCWATWT